MDVVIPEGQWDGDHEGVISMWIYSTGSEVRAGAVLAELMVEKVAVELLAPIDGRLNILQPADSLVRKGDVVATIE